MCVACDLLTGLDLDEIEAAAPSPWALHLPDGAAGVTLDAPVPPGLNRIPTLPGNQHWAPAPPDAATAADLVAQALQGYERYRRAAAAGHVAGGTRWQLSVPSPFTWLSRALPAEQVAGRLAAFTADLQAALARVAAELPPGDLALQWDVAGETALWESRGRDLTAGRQLAGRVLEGLVELAEAWPAGAELGYHLCRREAGGEWAPDPLDAAQISHLAGALLASVSRDIGFFHLPAPRLAAAPEWYAPLTRLQAWPQTALHVGVAWDDDDAGAVSARLTALHGLLPRALAAPACCARPEAARLALEAALRPA